MKALGCTYDEKQVGMFLWGKIPASCKDVEELTEKVLHEARVFITPGFILTEQGIFVSHFVARTISWRKLWKELKESNLSQRENDSRMRQNNFNENKLLKE